MAFLQKENKNQRYNQYNQKIHKKHSNECKSNQTRSVSITIEPNDKVLTLHWKNHVFLSKRSVNYIYRQIENHISVKKYGFVKEDEDFLA